MRLTFPNPSRSFDATRNRVQFWGYDNAFEISFLLEEDALKKLCPDMSHGEAGFLDAFDAARVRIHKIADKLYVQSSRRVYVFCLSAKDV